MGKAEVIDTSVNTNFNNSYRTAPKSYIDMDLSSKSYNKGDNNKGFLKNIRFKPSGRIRNSCYNKRIDYWRLYVF